MLLSKRLGTGLILAALLVAPGCGDKEHSSESHDPVPIVRTETTVATEAALPLLIEATGSVEAWRRASPGTKIMGRIESMPAREGDQVRQGQLLASFEKGDLEAAVSQAEAAVTMARAEMEHAVAQHRRMRTLHARGSATKKNVEDSEARFRVGTAGVKQAEANLAAAQVMLEYAEIRSPLDGWVVSRLAEVGDMTSPGMPLFVLEDLSQVKIKLTVAESDVVALKQGDEALVHVDVLAESRPAQIQRILPAGDPRSRTFEVHLLLSNPDNRLKSGMFARAGFEHGTRSAVLVPLSAVVQRGQLRGLFVIDVDDRARLRWVRLGRLEDGRAEVLSGLAAGERFVVSPPQGLADGVRVEPAS
jgi:RND family efflux transporter MFP subunit